MCTKLCTQPLCNTSSQELQSQLTPLFLLFRITGLDPATGLDMKPPHLRLNHNSALFTSAVHSDPSKYGSKRELGLVNFWPNYRAVGPVKQPGCTSSSSDRFSDDGNFIFLIFTWLVG